ncbi:Monothiol glutaredoxin-5 [Ceratobasidium theobromae]|uniref:Monothiol glutaredoxin-5, mitochondrial n=1 Tax=Ceratobasidium theobromae TaxID=1582974 RepID=A0A5N5QDL8_9AGAM|nr:Monothiol glutaredoxin-5 [Ceratobasidium theobromae]
MFRTGLRLATRTAFKIPPPPRIPIRLISDQARQAIDNAVKAKPLVLFMKGTPETPQCGFSRAVIQILNLHDVPQEKMQTYNVLEDPELRTSIKEYSDWPTIPQLYVKGEFVGGCDIVMNMHQSGELEDLLEKNEIIPPIPPNPKTP